jgi:hypothetical protein
VWYDIFPHVGTVLLLSGWLWGKRGAIAERPVAVSRGQAVGVAVLLGLFVTIHTPRMELIFIGRQPPPTAGEAAHYLTTASRVSRAREMVAGRARRLREYLGRLERAELIARERGIGRDAITREFQSILSPSNPRVDDAELLDLPSAGVETDGARVRAALGGLMVPRPVPARR